MSTIIDRILNQIGDREIIEKLLSLPRADLNSLLLELFEKQTERITPADMLKAYQSNRFSVPSEADPVAFHALETRLLSAAQGMDIQTVLLSPSAPLGSCSVSPLHYAATARAVRAQPFEGKGFYAHFGLYCMVSSGRDTGSYSGEKQLLEKHLLFYKEMLQKQFGARLSIVLRKRSGYKDADGFFDKITEAVQAMFPDTSLSFDCDDVDNKYYQGINFKIIMETKDGPIEIGDGGFVDWMSQMLGSKKERCLISGIGLDRLLLFCD